MEKKALSREAILTAQDIQREYVEMPEWGGGVYVSTISARAGLEMAGSAEEDSQSRAVVGLGLLLARSLTDEAGNLLFQEADIDFLMNKSRAAIERLTTVALRLNNFGAGAVAEAEKN